ncbi:hypothetical protein B566_EDAN005581 [Ephemera danica]|nr:hypothetical protein B566_EDAN005581 [Ephemera danica]
MSRSENSRSSVLGNDRECDVNKYGDVTLTELTHCMMGQKAGNTAILTKDGVVGVHGDLILCSISNETLCVCEGNITRRCTVSLVIGNNFDLAVLEDSHTRVCGAQVNSYCGGFGGHYGVSLVSIISAGRHSLVQTRVPARDLVVQVLLGLLGGAHHGVPQSRQRRRTLARAEAHASAAVTPQRRGRRMVVVRLQGLWNTIVTCAATMQTRLTTRGWRQLTVDDVGQRFLLHRHLEVALLFVCCRGRRLVVAPMLAEQHDHQCEDEHRQ